MPLSKKNKTMIILDPISGNRITIPPSDKPRRALLPPLPFASKDTDPSCTAEPRPSGADKIKS